MFISSVLSYHIIVSFLSLSGNFRNYFLHIKRRGCRLIWLSLAIFFSFFDKKLGEGVNRYESHPPSLRTIYFPTAPSIILFKLLFNLHAFHLRITTVNLFPIYHTVGTYLVIIGFLRSKLLIGIRNCASFFNC